MKWKYRIVKKRLYAHFTIERKPLTLWLFWLPWEHVTSERTVPECEKSVEMLLNNWLEPEMRIIRVIKP